MDNTFKFHTDFKTGKSMSEPLGRIYLASGEACRIFFTPTGLKLLLSANCLENGDIVTYKGGENLGGLPLGQVT